MVDGLQDTGLRDDRSDRGQGARPSVTMPKAPLRWPRRNVARPSAKNATDEAISVRLCRWQQCRERQVHADRKHNPLERVLQKRRLNRDARTGRT